MEYTEWVPYYEVKGKDRYWDDEICIINEDEERIPWHLFERSRNSTVLNKFCLEVNKEMEDREDDEVPGYFDLSYQDYFDAYCNLYYEMTGTYFRTFSPYSAEELYG